MSGSHLSAEEITQFVCDLYKSILNRDGDHGGIEAYTAYLQNEGYPRGVGVVVRSLINSQERRALERERCNTLVQIGNANIDSEWRFRTPNDLAVTQVGLRRVLLIGSCLLEPWTRIVQTFPDGCHCEHFLFNNISQPPESPSRPISDYDFQIISLPLRSILQGTQSLRMSSIEFTAREELLERSCDTISALLNAAMRWNTEHSLLTFVLGFLVPQQNALGRLLPRFNLSNPVYFVEKLNEHLGRELGTYQNAFYVDLNEISSSVGRQYVQDDSVCITSHNSVLNDFDYPYDQERISPPLRLTEIYDVRVNEFVRLTWLELLAMYRTIRQIDAVKLVIMDLDDTLWRGVLAEKDDVSPSQLEGWPLGVVEALSYLKNRGVILAIASKNEESFIRQIWERLVGKYISLDDFAFVKINWRPKHENVREILDMSKLLPDNVVFVDDNPVERAAVLEAFPGIRVLGADPYLLKRILLWSAETQVSSITSESSRRTEMMQSQAYRESARRTMSREQFLHSLNIQVEMRSILSPEQPDFSRAFELLNKTNQFNTTGTRWTFEEMMNLFKGGGFLIVFFVRDRYTDYGLVGVLVLQGTQIRQFVMSCRTLGLDVEIAVLEALEKEMFLSRGTALHGELVKTEKNMPCQDLYRRAGFEWDGAVWRSALNSPPPRAPHVALTIEDSLVKANS
jgi:FkbH-like protein